MSEDPRATVQAINETLRRCVLQGLPAPYVELAWRPYADLLRLKGIEWTPTNMTWDAKHEDRPLKSYFVFPLYLINVNASASMVLSKLPDGRITGWAIQFR